ncbi:hypothetical protein [Deferrisoma camini]|uniref:hypothetical protein n=1 Tax=Deferrisoma camini TaxID=1035120 RepID=UPI00046CC006|nr:hypothetical protein [Deferrisoma camini]
MDLIGRILLSPFVTGAGAGWLVLHPFAMVAVGGPGTGMGAAGPTGAFHLSMLPMAAAFAALGAVLAWAFHLAGPARRRLRDEPCGPTGDRGDSLLRTCMHCKAIPVSGDDGREHWLPLEQALFQTYHITFSHGICPHCMSAVVEPELRALRERHPSSTGTRSCGSRLAASGKRG